VPAKERKLEDRELLERPAPPHGVLEVVAKLLTANGHSWVSELKDKRLGFAEQLPHITIEGLVRESDAAALQAEIANLKILNQQLRSQLDASARGAREQPRPGCVAPTGR
jgi:hypothetical protein